MLEETAIRFVSAMIPFAILGFFTFIVLIIVGSLSIAYAINKQLKKKYEFEQALCDKCRKLYYDNKIEGLDLPKKKV